MVADCPNCSHPVIGSVDDEMLAARSSEIVARSKESNPSASNVIDLRQYRRAGAT